MFPLLDLVEKARKAAARLPAFAAKLADLTKKTAARAGELLKSLGTCCGERIRVPVPLSVREKLSRLGGKPGFALAGLGLGLSVLLVVLVTALVSPRAGRGQGDGVLIREAAIPPEEFFLPDEPDFLPGVILQREPRKVWGPEDVKPYWYDPLERGEEAWRDRIRAALDELLERVP